MNDVWTVYGMIIVPVQVLFGWFFIIRAQSGLRSMGIVLTALVCVLAPVMVVQSALALASHDTPGTLDAVARAGGIATVVWFSLLAVTPDAMLKRETTRH